ncbi:MAG: 3-hydroxyacyl-ACP dehydratase [Caldimonas sp.]
MSTEAITSPLRIAADHPAFDGHFPGQPILPGVALLAEVLEAAHDEPRLAAAIGAEPRLVVAKFLGAVLPGASLAIEFRLGIKGLDWRVVDGARTVASGQFALAAGLPTP